MAHDTATNVQRRKLRLLMVPLMLGCTSATLFIAQGGFGGGHGTVDWLIVTLMLPAVLLVQVVPLPSWILHYDFVYTIVLPTGLNTALVLLVGRLLSWIRSRRAPRAPGSPGPG